MSSNGQKQSLADAPQSVKECIDWLIRLGGNDAVPQGNGQQNISSLQNALQSGLGLQSLGPNGSYGSGSGNLRDLCQQLANFIGYQNGSIENNKGIAQNGEYRSAYQNNANWPNCRTGSSSYTCQCRHAGHSCQFGSCCNSCCHRVCARIFCLIIPIVHSALKFLYEKCGGGNGVNGYRQDSWYGQSISNIYFASDQGLSQYMAALGYTNGYYGAMLRSQSGSGLMSGTTTTGQQWNLGTIVTQLGQIDSQIQQALQQGVTGSTGSLVDGDQKNLQQRFQQQTPPSTPTSVRELMLWATFLPYCSEYQQVHSSLQNISGLLPSGTNGYSSQTLSPSSLIDALPLLFLAMEGGGNAGGHGGAGPSGTPTTLFGTVDLIAKGQRPYDYFVEQQYGVQSYGTDSGASKCARMLLTTLPIMGLGVQALLSEQNGGNSNNLGYGTGWDTALGFKNGMYGGQGMGPEAKTVCLESVYTAFQGVQQAYNTFNGNMLMNSNYGSTPSRTPKTLRDMLLWLQGLVASGQYSVVRTMLNNGGGAKGAGQPIDPLTNILFQLPYLFYSVEQGFEQYIKDLLESQGIGTAGQVGSQNVPAEKIFSYSSNTYNADITKQFSAYVTATYYMVKFLEKKCQGEWSQDTVGGVTLNGNGGLSSFLESMGWDRTTLQNTGLMGNSLIPVLQWCFYGQNGQTNSRGTVQNTLQTLFDKCKNTIQTHITTVSSTGNTPTTLRDIMLWLIGLPISSGYDTNKGKWNNGSGGSSPSTNNNSLDSMIHDLIVACFMLFQKLEGSFNTVLKFLQGDNGKHFDYNDPTKSGHMLFGSVSVIYSVVKFLEQRCNGTPTLGGGADSWKEMPIGNGATSGTTTNALHTFLKQLGWEGHLQGSNGAAVSATNRNNGSDLHTTLESYFGDVTQDNSTSASSYLPPSTSNVLKDLYGKAMAWFTKKATTPNQGATTPSNIHDMMLWLIGLPMTGSYATLTSGKLKKDKIEEVIGPQNTVASYSFGTSQPPTPQNVNDSIQNSSHLLVVTMIAIEGDAKSVMEFFTTNGANAKVFKSYNYGSDTNGTFELLKEYSYKVHTQLRFLLQMCSVEGENGGWKGCKIKENTVAGSTQATNSLVCSCSSQSSSNSGTTCSHGLLNTFLKGDMTTASGGVTFTNQLNTTGHEKNNVGMGFFNGMSTGASSSNAFKGGDIYSVLKFLVDGTEAYKSGGVKSTTTPPLTLLTQYTVAIGRKEPETLGDMFDLVYQMWSHQGQGKEKLDKQLETEFKVINGSETNNPWKTQLTSAIQDLFPSTKHTTSHKGDEKDLYSLMCSSSTSSGTTSTCAPYMKSLSYGLYKYYVPSIPTTTTGDFKWFQWLYDKIRKLLDELKKLKEAFDACECCRTATSSTCKGLIECPNAHPILYRFGFTFGDPGSLKNGNKKTCTDLKAQLARVLEIGTGTPASGSALFKVFEKMIEIVYLILKKKGEDKVGDWIKEKKKDDTILQDHFKKYVKRALWDSYPKLMCTFACKVFDNGHTCETHCTSDKHRAPDKTPPTLPSNGVSSDSIQVSKSTVTSILPIIPTYTPPHIDPFQYHTYKKDKNTNANYTFQDFIDFHLPGSQCITPPPISLRQIIDWLLRVTVGDIGTGKESEVFKGFVDEVKKALKPYVNNSDKLENGELSTWITESVKGLQKFVGYENKDKEVKDGVQKQLGNSKPENNNSVKKLLEKELDKLNKFLNKDNGKASEYGVELGKALLKGRYEINGDIVGNVLGGIMQHIGILIDKKHETSSHFSHIVSMLSEVMTWTHPSCSLLKCKGIDSSAPSSNGSLSVTAKGLTQLYNFFSKLKTFAGLWETIGVKGKNGGTSSSSVVYQQRQAVERILQFNGSNANGQYFTQLHKALEKLGDCAENVNDLNSNGTQGMTSETYRGKITTLITKLKNEVLSCLTDNQTKESSKADPNYAVDGAKELIKQTKKQVEKEITSILKTEIKNAYGFCNGKLGIVSLKEKIASRTEHSATTYSSHLDDLRKLCQWLYRMGQLYKAGLKGFIESLVKHLEHIEEVIRWMEGIYKMMETLKEVKDVEKKNGIEVKDFDALKECCKVDGHENLCESNKFNNYKDFFTALNCRFDRILHSYTIQDSSAVNDTEGTYKNYRSFLQKLRLLALDRYTLQVWKDNEGEIKNWIVFNGEGVVRASNKDEIKKKLSELTGIHYASGSSDPRVRIHNFHAVCVIQKFSSWGPIHRLEESIGTLRKINEKLEGVYDKVKKNGHNLDTDNDVTQFTTAVSKFLDEDYGIYNFARFLHVILGPNHFSAMIRSLEELKDKTNYTIKKPIVLGILHTLTQGYPPEEEYEKSVQAAPQQPPAKSPTPTKRNLEHYIGKLNEFITTMRQEYIFSYPVVRGDIQALASTSSSADLATATPPSFDHNCLTGEHTPEDHKDSICQNCLPGLAHMLISMVPHLYTSLKFIEWRIRDRWLKKFDELAGSADTNKLAKKDKIINEVPRTFSNFGFDEHNLRAFSSYHYRRAINPKDQLKKLIEENIKPLYEAVMSYIKLRVQKEIKDRVDSKNPFKTPLTIRDMLHWLSGLQFLEGYDDLRTFVEDLCNKTEKLALPAQKDTDKNHPTPSTTTTYYVKGENVWHRFEVCVTHAVNVLYQLERPEQKESGGPIILSLLTQTSQFMYPTDVAQLFYMMLETVYNVYVHLGFLNNMCQREKEEGGWTLCELNHSEAPTMPYDKRNVIECKCPGSVLEYECPRPLYRFMSSKHNAFSGIPMGFNVNLQHYELLKGSYVHNFLQHFVGKQCILQMLCKDLIAASAMAPLSMGDMVSFFVGIYTFWTKTQCDDLDDDFKPEDYDRVKTELHDWIRTCPGTFDAKRLTGALADVVSGHGEEQSGGQSGGAGGAGAGTHIDDTDKLNHNLTSLMNCDPSTPSPPTCAPYLKPMAYDIYTVFVPQFSRSYLSWILHFGPSIYGALKELHKELGSHNTTPKTCDKPSIVQSPFVLPKLYNIGCDFWSAETLNGKTKSGGSGQKKTCNNLVTQLKAVLAPCPTPLSHLIETIEQFLWSIRLPFAGSQLALWFITLVFLCYVFVVPLDHFHIRSHYFNKLRFTIHPSLLLAHQQRRVSEVSYFFV